MREMNVKKIPGYSQRQVYGKNHTFFVGERSHPKVLLMQIGFSTAEKLLPID